VVHGEEPERGLEVHRLLADHVEHVDLAVLRLHHRQPS
jgi:hypothetical protein